MASSDQTSSEKDNRNGEKNSRNGEKDNRNGSDAGLSPKDIDAPAESIQDAPSDEKRSLSGDVPLKLETRDENVVDWEGADDPQHPRNWTLRTKVFNMLTVIVMVLVTPLASSMFAPGVPQVLRTFQSGSMTLAAFVVSVYILGFAFGPLLISPLSEIYGRYPVYIVCNIMFVVFTVACAVSSSLSQLIVFRFIAGCFGVCPVTLGGATISDLVPQERRGTWITLFAMGPLLGPVIGPICGSYISANVGWRWTFWVIAIAYGVLTVAHTLFGHETYAPALLARKTARLRKETGNQELRPKRDDELTKKQYITRAIVRPMKMLLRSPIVFLMALYVAVVYAILYLLYTTFTFVFEEFYHFSPANVGLTYIANGIGMFVGLIVVGTTSDRLLKSKAAKYGGELKPEYRLIPIMFMCWLPPIGLFIYGWTAQNQVQWAVPMFGTLLFGMGIISAMICIQQYLIDAYTAYAASVIAANTLLRSIIGGILPLAGLDMYKALGLGWGNSLITFITVVMMPIPFAFYVYGERIRKGTKVKF